VFEGNRSVECFHNINHSSFCSSDPICELHVVRYGGTEHDYTDVLWQHDDGLLPDDSSLFVVDVMHLVEDYPLDVSDHL